VPNWSRPAHDEIEVTILGRGVGESCVVHLGDGEWLIVDSFNDATDYRPAALRYLEAIGADPGGVKHLVVTHFDVDHYRGIDRLHDACPNAVLWTTGALSHHEFIRLYGDRTRVPLLGVLPGTIQRAAERKFGVNPGLRSLQAGSQLRSDPSSSVRALSPTPDAVLASASAVAAVAESGWRDHIVDHLRDDNRCSVVLHFDFEQLAVLLAGDLLREPPRFGWQAVLDDLETKHLRPADLYKVSHHGSDTGHQDDVHGKLVEPEAIAVVSPFWPSALPQDSDRERLVVLAEELWQTAQSVSFDMDEFGNRVSRRQTTGLVQARRRRDEAAWRVRYESPAFLATRGAGPHSPLSRRFLEPAP
jgi:hypothetical protein